MRAKTVNEMGMTSASGIGGSLQTPQSKRRLTRAEADLEREGELEEEQVHPDDKIGNMMLKKMGVPSYFKSNKKEQSVSQKKVDEGSVNPHDTFGLSLLDRMGIPNYFEGDGDETHQKDVEKVRKPYVPKGYANTKTDSPDNTTGNYKGS